MIQQILDEFKQVTKYDLADSKYDWLEQKLTELVESVPEHISRDVTIPLITSWKEQQLGKELTNNNK